MPIPNIRDTTFEKYKTVKIYVKVSESACIPQNLTFDQVSEMGLDIFEEDVLKELVGKRYDKEKDELKLVCRNFPSRQQNLDGVKKLMWEVKTLHPEAILNLKHRF